MTASTYDQAIAELAQLEQEATRRFESIKNLLLDDLVGDQILASQLEGQMHAPLHCCYCMRGLIELRGKKAADARAGAH